MNGTRRAGVWIALLLGVLAWTPDAPHAAEPCGTMHGAEGGAHGDGCAHTGAAECGCAARADSGRTGGRTADPAADPRGLTGRSGASRRAPPP